jgi:hypothetical protein
MAAGVLTLSKTSDELAWVQADEGWSLLSEYMDRGTLAVQLGVHVRTLDRWEAERTGPPRTLIGRQVLYRISSLREWLLSQEQHTPNVTGGDGKRRRNGSL